MTRIVRKFWYASTDTPDLFSEWGHIDTSEAEVAKCIEFYELATKNPDGVLCVTGVAIEKAEVIAGDILCMHDSFGSLYEATFSDDLGIYIWRDIPSIYARLSKISSAKLVSFMKQLLYREQHRTLQEYEIKTYKGKGLGTYLFTEEHIEDYIFGDSMESRVSVFRLRTGNKYDPKDGFSLIKAAYDTVYGGTPQPLRDKGIVNIHTFTLVVPGIAVIDKVLMENRLNRHALTNFGAGFYCRIYDTPTLTIEALSLRCHDLLV